MFVLVGVYLSMPVQEYSVQGRDGRHQSEPVDIFTLNCEYHLTSEETLIVLEQVYKNRSSVTSVESSNWT